MATGDDTEGRCCLTGYDKQRPGHANAVMGFDSVVEENRRGWNVFHASEAPQVIPEIR